MSQLPTNSVLGTLGPRFSFHDILRKEKMDHLPVQYFNSFEAIFNSLQNDKIQAALIATKNSIHGKIVENTKMIANLGLQVIEHFDLPISLHLAAKKTIGIAKVKKIYAHRIAWSECQSFLGSHPIQHIDSSSNSQALTDLKNDPESDTAAISSREAIRQSTLKLICEDIHDHNPNITSFSLVIKKNGYR